MRFGTKMRATGVLVLAALVAAAAPLILVRTIQAQTQPAQTQVVRYLGTVTAISGDTLTVKTDAGQVNQVEVPATAQLKRIAPGQTDLSKAEILDFASIATGDRVLVTLDPNTIGGATGATPQALRIIAIKQADVAQKQQNEAEQWNQGVHGLVKSVDAAAGVIEVNVRVGVQTKEVAVNTTQFHGAQALRSRLGAIRSGAARADHCHQARRPVVGARDEERRWIRDCGGRHCFRQLPLDRRNDSIH